MTGSSLRSAVLQSDVHGPTRPTGRERAKAVEERRSSRQEGPLSLSTRVEYSAMPKGATMAVFGLVTVQETRVRAPVFGGGRS